MLYSSRQQSVLGKTVPEVLSAPRPGAALKIKGKSAQMALFAALLDSAQC